MPEIRFRGLAAQNSTLDEFLRQYFGYRAIRDGADWVIPANDKVLRRGPKDVLQLGSDIELESARFSDIAHELIACSPAGFEEYTPDLPIQINVPADLGVISKADRLTIEVTIAEKKDLPRLVARELLPFMVDLGATHVAAISVDPNAQAYISIAKVAYLLQIFGCVKTETLLEKRVLHSISPDPLTVLGYVDHFTNIVPRAITLPVYRRGVAWHFYRKGGWTFPHGSTIGLPGQFQRHSHPTSFSGDFGILRRVKDVSTDDIWRALRAIVFGINTLMRFVNNPLHFADTKGKVDFLKQLQTMSAISLLFADLGRIAADSDSYNRTVFALSALDKLANLRTALGPAGGSEGANAKALLSIRQGRQVRRTFRKHIAPRWPELAKWLCAATGLFHDSHRYLINELGDDGRKEGTRLSYLRARRNLIHGAFLSNRQFDRLFLTSPGNVPAELPSLPFLLVLALMFAPKEFLEFQPAA